MYVIKVKCVRTQRTRLRLSESGHNVRDKGQVCQDTTDVIKVKYVRTQRT